MRKTGDSDQTVSLDMDLIRGKRQQHGEARLAAFDFIEVWYEPKRRHSALGEMSPVRFEELHRQAAAAA
jgi:putative transposase